MGWDRLVRSVKTCLRKVLGQTSLSFEELTTIRTEVEATLNSRPLSVVNNDPDEPQPFPCGKKGGGCKIP